MTEIEIPKSEAIRIPIDSSKISLQERLTPTPPTPSISFSVCEEDDEILTHSDVLLEDSPVSPDPNCGEIENPTKDKRGSVFAFPSLNQLRRMSDTSLKHVKEKLLRMSTSTSSASWLVRCTNSRSVSRHSRPTTAPQAASAPRKMSVDMGGILKQSPPKSYDEAHDHRHGFLKFVAGHGGLGRKCVSFSIRDNVRLFDRWEEEDEYEEEEVNDEIEKAADDEEDSSRGRSLVPTFVFPGKRPTYAKDFEKNVIILESVDITEDLCIMGNIRVNMTKLRGLQSTVKNHRSSGRVSVGATYSTDGWKTSRDTRAMVVNAQPHPALTGKDTRAMRFYIDCDELETGDVVEFWLWCCDKFYPIVATSSFKHGRQRSGIAARRYIDTSSPPVVKKYRDDNDGSKYKISCTPRLNGWAAKAAQELNRFTPIVRYNQNYV